MSALLLPAHAASKREIPPTPPLKIETFCEWVLGDNDMSATGNFTLDPAAGSAATFGASFFAPADEDFLFAIRYAGTTSIDDRFVSHHFVLNITPVFDPNQHYIGGGHKDPATGEWIGRHRPDAVSAGLMTGQYTAWVNIYVTPEGVITADVNEGERRIEAKDGRLEFDMKYALKTDETAPPSGKYLLGAPLEEVIKPIRRFLKPGATGELEITYAAQLTLKVKLQMRSAPPEVSAPQTELQR